MAQVCPHQFQQGLADQAGFARAGNTGNGGKAAQRKCSAQVIEVIARDAFKLQPVAGLAGGACGLYRCIEQVGAGA
ncbi:hypothetical protein D3C71_1806550 [compost metagenome]